MDLVKRSQACLTCVQLGADVVEVGVVSCGAGWALVKGCDPPSVYWILFP